MTPAEINRRLALPIGYRPEDVRVDRGEGKGAFVNCTSSSPREVPTIDLGEIVSVKAILKRSMEDQKWTLISPAGEVWIEADPTILVCVLSRSYLGLNSAPRSKE